MDRNSFRGIFVIVTTPFTDDFQLDEAGLERTMALLVVHGVFMGVFSSVNLML